MMRVCGWIVAATLCGTPALASLALVAKARAVPKPQATAPIDFPTGVLPLLTKAGCNSGTCHGAAIGQGGFRLSLLGYDPESDHAAISRELGGRRLQLNAPTESLLLRKASGITPHGGGSRIAAASAAHGKIQAWISAGAPYGTVSRSLSALEITPRELLLPALGRRQNLKVVARFSDGSREDVTPLALFSSDDDAVASVDPTGVVTVRGRGLTPVMVRYLGEVAAVRAGAPFADQPLKASLPAASGPVDAAVFPELARLRLPLSPLSEDDEFLRRVYLDLLGVLPTPEEVRAFLADTDQAKRTALIDRLLTRPEFTDYWTLHWAELLRIDSKRLGPGAAQAYHSWLRSQVARNTPLHEMARSLLTASGDAAVVGPVNFYRSASDPRDLSEVASRTLLGVRVECARCHNHPFDRWTQNDYYGFAALFARVRFEGTRLVDAAQGELEHPKSGLTVAPKPLGVSVTTATTLQDRRAVLAGWLLADGNRLLARNLANRIWKKLMGRGLVEPVDDLRASNPPSNPALLHALTEELAAGGYDLRKLVRTIVSSRTYQSTSRSVPGNKPDDRFSSHSLVRPLPAQVLADAISQATGVPDQYAGQAPGTRAVQLLDGRVPSETLDALGRCLREGPCDPAGLQGGLPAALHLINGEGINAKLSSGVAERLTREGLSDRAMVEELFLRTLSRFPDERERSECEKLLASSPARRERIQDLFWALLNSREFAFNH